MSMEKQEIVKRIFEEGIMVSPEAMKGIDEGNVSAVIGYAKKKGIRVLKTAF